MESRKKPTDTKKESNLRPWLVDVRLTRCGKKSAPPESFNEIYWVGFPQC